LKNKIMVGFSSSFKNLLFKKMPFSYNEYSALLLHFALCGHKAFLFTQKNQTGLKLLLTLLTELSLLNNYMVTSTSFIKLLFKFDCSFDFFFRELILIFFDDDSLISRLLNNSDLQGNIVFFCYRGFFFNANFLKSVGNLSNLFPSNFSAIKSSAKFAIYCISNYTHLIFNQTAKI